MKIHRALIISTALELLDEVGLDGLTMRTLAKALKVQAPSLYWHFPNKKALIEGMADALVEPVARTAFTSSWEHTLRSVGGELRLALLARRDAARVFAGTYAVSENVLRVGDSMIGALIKGGASTKLASWGAFSLLYYVLGFIMEEQALGPENGEDRGARRVELLSMTQHRFPATFSAADDIFDVDMDQRFELGLEVFIAGLASRIGVEACNRKQPCS